MAEAHADSMRPTSRLASANEVAAYRLVVWTELFVLCALFWRAIIMLALALVH
jgi:hypothetical protein